MGGWGWRNWYACHFTVYLVFLVKLCCQHGALQNRPCYWEGLKWLYTCFYLEIIPTQKKIYPNS